MVNYYYLDVESSGLNSKEDKILTIQYQKLDTYGNPIEDLVILKEWESSEENIIKKFYSVFVTESVWNFIPILQNNLFDFSFLLEKFRKYGLKIDERELDFLFKLPIIDLHSVLVIINNMSFKGSGLNSMTEKKGEGGFIPDLYAKKEYAKIEEYIKQETASFISAFQILCRELPKLKNLLKKQNGK